MPRPSTNEKRNISKLYLGSIWYSKERNPKLPTINKNRGNIFKTTDILKTQNTRLLTYDSNTVNTPRDTSDTPWTHINSVVMV